MAFGISGMLTVFKVLVAQSFSQQTRHKMMRLMSDSKLQGPRRLHWMPYVSASWAPRMDPALSQTCNRGEGKKQQRTCVVRITVAPGLHLANQAVIFFKCTSFKLLCPLVLCPPVRCCSRSSGTRRGSQRPWPPRPSGRAGLSAAPAA